MATQQTTPDQGTMQAELERLRAENDKLRAQQNQPRKLTLKVSEKGAVSVYGMGRFPVTLYGEQWTKLEQFMPTIRQFIVDNRGKLAVKDVA